MRDMTLTWTMKEPPNPKPYLPPFLSPSLPFWYRYCMSSNLAINLCFFYPDEDTTAFNTSHLTSKGCYRFTQVHHPISLGHDVFKTPICYKLLPIQSNPFMTMLLNFNIHLWEDLLPNISDQLKTSISCKCTPN